jgi:type I restriction enzyme M protein
MIWIAPSEKDQATDALETRLWAAADQLRANSGLTSQQYSQPVLGLVFLRFAEVRFSARHDELQKIAPSSRRGSRVDEPSAYHAEGVLYLSPNARFDYLLALPEGEAVGKAVSEAMRDIEKNNPSLSGVLPKTYEIFNSTLLKELLKKVSEIPAGLGYDAFGRIYEYFLGEFARTEGQKRAGNFLRQVALSDCSSKYSNRSTGAFWTRLADPGACLSRAHGSWRSINETVILRKVLVPQPRRFLSTVRRRRVKR